MKSKAHDKEIERSGQALACPKVQEKMRSAFAAPLGRKSNHISEIFEYIYIYIVDISLLSISIYAYIAFPLLSGFLFLSPFLSKPTRSNLEESKQTYLE